jgi:hypothetical protein
MTPGQHRVASEDRQQESGLDRDRRTREMTVLIDAKLDHQD